MREIVARGRWRITVSTSWRYTSHLLAHRTTYRTCTYEYLRHTPILDIRMHVLEAKLECETHSSYHIHACSNTRCMHS